MEIIEVAVPIIVGILGISYPILLQMMDSVGGKYNSAELVELFEKKNNAKRFSYFLIINLIALLVYLIIKWIIPLTSSTVNKIPLCWECIICAILLILVTLLVISFFQYVNLLKKFYSIQSIIKELSGPNTPDCDEKFKSFADIFLWAVKRQDNNIVIKIFESYLKDKFASCYSFDGPTLKEVNYPVLYYNFLYETAQIVTGMEKNRVILAESISIGGELIFPYGIPVLASDENYQWMWRMLLLAVESHRDDHILRYWINVYPYYEYLNPNYTSDKNTKNIELLNKQRGKLVNFNYHLCGLLLRQEMYECLNRILNYSANTFQHNDIIPQNATDALLCYYKVRMDTSLLTYIDNIRYDLPNIEGVYSESQSKIWIEKYLLLVFVRLFSFNTGRITVESIDQKYRGLIIREINGTIELIGQLVNNALLMRAVGISMPLNELKQKLSKELKSWAERVKGKYNETTIFAKMVDTKVDEFVKTSRKLIQQQIKEYDIFENSDIRGGDSHLTFRFDGFHQYLPKAAFFKEEDAEMTYMHYDSILAQSVLMNWRKYFGIVFNRLTTEKYLFHEADMKEALLKMGVLNNEKFIILSNAASRLLTGIPYSNVHDVNFENMTPTATFYILPRTDIPHMELLAVSKSEKKLYNLINLIPKKRVYYSLIDVYNDKKKALEILRKFNDNPSMQEITPEIEDKVIASIYMNVELIFKIKPNIIRVSQYSPYREQGVVNKLIDVKKIDIPDN